MASCALNLQAAASSFLSPSSFSNNNSTSNRNYKNRAATSFFLPPSSFSNNNSIKNKNYKNRVVRLRVRAESVVIEKLGITIEKNPSESRLTQLGVKHWPTWQSMSNKHSWGFGGKSTCYLIEGKFKVVFQGLIGQFVEIEAGDLVDFPKGMTCDWLVSVPVNMHYLY